MMGFFIPLGITLFFCWLIWRLNRDKGFTKRLPHGTCQARMGMITCGKDTNHFDGKYWYCSEHPPEGAVR